jgi:hypothetical protein
VLYEVQLQSTADPQRRTRIIDAKSVQAARAEVERREANRAAYSLLDLAPVRSIETRRHADGVHARVRISPFADTGLSGSDLLAFAERDHAIDADGKAYGPNKHLKAHLSAHYQRDPYEIQSVEPFVPNVDQIITALKHLQGSPEAWDRAVKRMRDEGLPLGVVTGSLYGLTAQKMLDGSTPIVWVSATIKCGLTTSTYTPNQDTHHFWSDVTNEVTGTGYIAGGVTLTTTGGSSYDTATDQIRLDGTDASWATSTITARRAVVWNDTAGASTTDPVMGWVDFGADVATTAGTFQITWDTTGIIVYDVT